MNWLNEFGGRAERDVPLAEHTWFGLGGRARYMVHPPTVESLGELLVSAVKSGIPVKVLGGGANVLVRDDGFDGLVIRLDEQPFNHLEIDGESVRAGAGVDLMRLTRECCRRGLTGLECLAGIPGTVGGAIRMNAGGRFGEIGESVETVDVVLPDGRTQRLCREDVGFGYRHTRLGDAVVTAATLRLRQGDPDEVYARYREIWQVKKAAQPMADHSAGCIFANPDGDSAGRLIDEAGLKGSVCGKARVSPRHANFIVADKGAKAADVLALIDRIRQTVHDEFGTDLDLEIDVW